MGSYAGGHSTPAGTNLTILALESGATVRARIFEFLLGSITTPDDKATEFNLLRHTTAGIAGTTVVEKPLDADFVAATANLRGGTMTEPTYETDELMNISLNQRATFRWVAAPDRRLITTAGTANGIGVRAISSGATPTTNCTLMWDE